MTTLTRLPSRTLGALAALLLVLLLSACGGEKPDKLVASAKQFLAKDDTKAAVIQLKNALQADVTLPEARYLLGVALLRQGDAAGAEAELRKALSYKFAEDSVLPPLAQALLAQRQYRKLTDEFSGTTLTEPAAQANLQTTLATAFAAQRLPEQSRDALRTALEADPTYTPARLIQVRDKASQRDFDGALADTEAIITATPTSHEAWKLKGDLLFFGKKQHDPGLAAYARAIELRPVFIEAHVALLDALVGQGKFDVVAKQLEQLRKAAPNSLSVKYYETLLAYQKKDLKLALSLGAPLLQQAPENVRSLQLVGEIELAANSLVQAQAHLSEAVRLVPQATRPRRALVQAYLRGGQPAKALAILQPLLKGEVVDAASNLLAGEVYLQNGDPKKAEEYFAKASKQDPKNARARTALAVTQLAGGGAESALGQLQEIAGTDTGSTADLALISAHLRRQEYDRALKAIDNLEKKQADKPLAAVLRGRTLLAKKDAAGARKSFERAVVIDPMYFPAVASLAALDMADKKPDEARTRFESVLKSDPKNPQALLALAQLRSISGGPKEEVAELMNKAINANPTEKQPRLLLVDLYLRNKDNKLALATAQSAVSVLPDSPELLDALGRAQQASGDTNQALASFAKLASMQPESPLAQMRTANAQMAAGNKEAALTSLRKALTMKPDLLDAQRGLLMLAVEGKRYDEARGIARSVQKQRPKEIAGFLFEGDVAAAEKKWDAAADAYRAGLKLNASPLLATKTHAAQNAAGKTAEATTFSNNWLRDNPKDILFRLYLGDQAGARGDYVTAEKLYANAVQVQPDNPTALNNLAWTLGRQQKEGGIVLAEKAVALAPNQPAYIDTLAMLLSDKNDYARALEWQKKAVALQPELGLLRLNLAKIHIKGGKKDLARPELEALAKLGDKFAGQAEVASLLKSL